MFRVQGFLFQDLRVQGVGFLRVCWVFFVQFIFLLHQLLVFYFLVCFSWGGGWSES